MAAMTYEQIVDECKRLRGAYEVARSEFFLFLMRVEREMTDVWMAAGCSTFDQFLRSNNLADREQYRTFIRGVEKIGEREAVQLGSTVTLTAGVMADLQPRAIEMLKERSRAFVSVHHTPPSKKTADEWRREFAREERKSDTPSVVRKASELERLREENRRLKAELEAAHKRIAELEGRGGTKPRRKKVA